MKTMNEKKIKGVANLAVPFESGSVTVYLPLHMLLERIIEEVASVHALRGETVTYTAKCGRITFEF